MATKGKMVMDVDTVEREIGPPAWKEPLNVQRIRFLISRIRELEFQLAAARVPEVSDD